jgi:hypothetical protein
MSTIHYRSRSRRCPGTLGPVARAVLVSALVTLLLPLSAGPAAAVEPSCRASQCDDKNPAATNCADSGVSTVRDVIGRFINGYNEVSNFWRRAARRHYGAYDQSLLGLGRLHLTAYRDPRRPFISAPACTGSTP